MIFFKCTQYSNPFLTLTIFLQKKIKFLLFNFFFSDYVNLTVATTLWWYSPSLLSDFLLPQNLRCTKLPFFFLLQSSTVCTGIDFPEFRAKIINLIYLTPLIHPTKVQGSPEIENVIFFSSTKRDFFFWGFFFFFAFVFFHVRWGGNICIQAPGVTLGESSFW